jgi:hypothetical protein
MANKMAAIIISIACRESDTSPRANSGANSGANSFPTGTSSDDRTRSLFIFCSKADNGINQQRPHEPQPSNKKLTP